jgi:hypothetical protein
MPTPEVFSGLPHPESNSFRKPQQLLGALDRYTSFDVTPTIGREFPDASLRTWLQSPDSDVLLKDLAITGKYSPPVLDYFAESIH